MFEAHISLSLSSFQATKQRLEKVRLLPGILFHSALSPSTDSHRKTKFSQLMDKVIISVGVGASTINMRNFIVNIYIYTHTHTLYTTGADLLFWGDFSTCLHRELWCNQRGSCLPEQSMPLGLILPSSNMGFSPFSLSLPLPLSIATVPERIEMSC